MTVKKINCPQCNKATIWDTKNDNRPFCSDRCKLIDLGAWADESYQISSANNDEEEFSTSMQNLISDKQTLIH